MNVDITYTSKERFWLWTVAIVGVTVINGTFFYAILAQPESLKAALANPISLAFMVEATLLLGLLAYLLAKWRVSRFSPVVFVLIALLGTMAFALPAAVLWKRRD